MKGPRYWQQRVVARPEGAGPLGALYGRGALPVQLQRWALSYTQDPSGVRGLLSQAFDEVCAHVNLCDMTRTASQRGHTYASHVLMRDMCMTLAW